MDFERWKASRGIPGSDIWECTTYEIELGVQHGPMSTLQNDQNSVLGKKSEVLPVAVHQERNVNL